MAFTKTSCNYFFKDCTALFELIQLNIGFSVKLLAITPIFKILGQFGRGGLWFPHELPLFGARLGTNYDHKYCLTKEWKISHVMQKFELLILDKTIVAENFINLENKVYVE